MRLKYFKVLASIVASTSASISPRVSLLAPDLIELTNGHVRLLFNLTRGATDILQGRFAGDGDFSAAPNLVGMPGTNGKNN